MTDHSLLSKQIDEGLVLTGTGCFSDILALSKAMRKVAVQYKLSHDIPLSVRALSSILSHQLYSRRFMPYFSFCAIGGIDDISGKFILAKYTCPLKCNDFCLTQVKTL